MAIHPELAKDNFALTRKIFKALYSNIDINWDTAKFEGDKEGRLSFAFFITGKTLDGQNDVQFFAKISDKVGERDNTAFGAEVSECCVKLGMPVPKTFANCTDILAPQIPPETSQTFADRTVLLQELREKTTLSKEEEAKRQLAIGYRMGECLASLWSTATPPNFKVGIVHPNCQDMLDYTNTIHILCTTFQIDGTRVNEDDYIKQQATLAATNLRSQLPENANALSLASSLEKGGLVTIIRTLTRLQPQTTQRSLQIPKTVINGDFKRNNMFIKTKGKDDVEITTWFDFDLAGWGPRTKDLGRTIMFECFNEDGTEFKIQKAVQIIKGVQNTLEHHKPLSKQELMHLGFFIQEACCIQFALRTNYFTAEIQGKVAEQDTDRPDPSIHLRQLHTIQEVLTEKGSFQDIMTKESTTIQHPAEGKSSAPALTATS